MKRLLLMSMMVALILAAALTAMAQTPDPRCIALTEEDCGILQQAQENMDAIGSYNNKEFTITLGGGGGESGGNSTELTGSGPVVIGEDGLITALHFNVSGSLNGSSPQTNEVIWLDHMIYIGTPDGSGELSWTGTPDDVQGATYLSDVLSGNLFIKALREPGVAVAQRLEDTELDGQTMLVFQSDVDLVAMLSTSPFLDLLQALMESMPSDVTGGASGGQELTPTDLTGAIQLLPMLMSRDTVQTVQWVGADDGLMHHVELKLDLTLNAAMVDPTVGEINLQLELISDLDQLGEPVTIEAPADFELQDTIPIDLSTIDLGAFGSGASSASATPEPLVVEDSLSYGDTVTGTLSADNLKDVWSFEGETGDVVTIVMKATSPESSLDAQVYIRDADGNELGFNDDNDGSLDGLGVFDSLLTDVELPADGQYLIVATWLSETRDGDYELSLEKAD